MEAPIVPFIHLAGCLLGSIQQGLHDRRARELAWYLLQETERLRPQAVILDFSVIPLIDSFLCRILLDTAISCRLLGSQLLLCNLPNAVIISMVELGIIMPAGTVVSNVDMALGIVHGQYS